MTVTTSVNKIIGEGDGIQVDFPYDFIVLEESHMNVYIDGDLEDPANWSMTGIGVQVGGVVTMATAPADLASVTLLRIVPNTQLIDYSAYGSFPAETHERALDLRVMEAQQLQELNNRSLSTPVDYEGVFDQELPAPPVANRGWKVNATGDGIVHTDADPDEQEALAAAQVVIATTQAVIATTQATASQLSAWEAEAEALTAGSYASEAEDVFVNIVTSDGDGTFTYTPTTEYSAKHWATKALADLEMVSSIADLRLVLPSTSENVILTGYYAAGDGGGGSFYWDAASTEADNGGTIIKATAVATGRWKRIYSGAVNAKWFGAIGDGATDDTTPLAAWAGYISSIASASNPVIANVPAGYTFISNTTIPITPFTTYTGGGTLSCGDTLPMTSTLMAVSSGSGTIDVFENSNIIFDGITLDGRGRVLTEVSTTQSLIRFDSIDGLTIKNCTFKQHRKGLVTILGCRNVKVVGNTFFDWGFTAPDGTTGDGGSAIFCGWNYVDFTLSRDVVISDNIIHDGNWTAISCYSDDTIISENTIKNTRECGIFIRNDAGGGDCKNMVVDSNIIKNVTDIYIDAAGIVFTATDSICTNNNISLCDNFGISMGESASGLLIDGNILTNCANDPTTFPSGAQISLRNLDGGVAPEWVTISNNLIRDTNTVRKAPRGISITQVSGVAVPLTGIEVVNNHVVLASLTSANAIVFSSTISGNFCQVGDNRGSSLRLGLQSNQVIYRNFAALDFPSIAAQSQANLDITIPGSILVAGDLVTMGLPANGFNNGIAIKAYVTDADTLRVQAINVTSSAFDPVNVIFSYSISR